MPEPQGTSLSAMREGRGINPKNGRRIQCRLTTGEKRAFSLEVRINGFWCSFYTQFPVWLRVQRTIGREKGRRIQGTGKEFSEVRFKGGTIECVEKQHQEWSEGFGGPLWWLRPI